MFRSLTHELRHAHDIIHGAKAIAGQVATIVEPRISTALEAARNLPEQWLALFQLGLASLIDMESEAAIEAERQLRKERRKETEARNLRETAKQVLYQVLLKARIFLEGALGPGASAALVGLDPNLAQMEALVLLRYGAEFEGELLQPDFRLEAFVIDGAVTTPAEYAAKVREATQALRAAEDNLADQVRMTEQKLKVKEKKVDQLGKCNGSCGRMLEELYVLAGEEFHAERLRKSSRRRAASTVEDDPALVAEHFGDDEGELLGDEELGLDGEVSQGASAATSAPSADDAAPKAG